MTLRSIHRIWYHIKGQIKGYNMITIDGKTYEGTSVTMSAGKIVVDGVDVTDQHSPDKGITIIGSPEIVTTDKVVTVRGDVNGNVFAGSSVTCGDVKGNVEAGSSVTCGNVEKSVYSGSSVSCDDVGGDVNAGTSVSCDDVSGNVTRKK